MKFLITKNPPNEIDVLLGGDVIADILQEGFKPGISGTPIAQNTIFGWTLSGAIFSDRHGIYRFDS